MVGEEEDGDDENKSFCLKRTRTSFCECNRERWSRVLLLIAQALQTSYASVRVSQPRALISVHHLVVRLRLLSFSLSLSPGYVCKEYLTLLEARASLNYLSHFQFYIIIRMDTMKKKHKL